VASAGGEEESQSGEHKDSVKKATREVLGMKSREGGGQGAGNQDAKRGDVWWFYKPKGLQ